MKTIEYYLRKLKDIKQRYITYLRMKNISCEDDEKLNSLILKTESVYVPATNKQSLPDFSLRGCNLEEEELNNLISLLNLSNPSTNISSKFSDVPNLKTLDFADFNITQISSASGAFTNTPLEYLYARNIAIDTYTFFSTSGSAPQNYYNDYQSLPKTLKKIDFTNSTFSTSSIRFDSLEELEEVIGLDTITATSVMSGSNLAYIAYKCKKLKKLDLRNFTIASGEKLLFDALNGCNELEEIYFPTGFTPNCKSLDGCFAYCDKLSWEQIKNTIKWDEITFTTSTYANVLTDFMCVSAPEFLNGDLTDYRLENVEFKRVMDEFDLSPIPLYTTSGDIFGGVRVKHFIMSNMELRGQNYGCEFFTGEFTRDGYTYPNYIDKITITDCVIGYRCTTAGRSGTKYIPIKDNTQTIELNNVRLKSYQSSASANISGFLIGWGGKEIDLSSVKFGDDAATSMSIDAVIYNCPNLEKIIGPDLENETYKITSAILFSLCPNVLYYDGSKIPLDNVSSPAYGLPDLDKATFVSFGANLGKALTQKSASYSSYTVGALQKNTDLEKECLIDFFNKLYDLNITYGVYDEEGNPGTGKLYTQRILLTAQNKAKLTPEEIAIATNKGWTVS